ncbi:hypothetical protein C8R44DRAFT_894890 [Mycena epipterygia]|nr:hypothetical protein C8R44DRAFT_894890 [Mycena epipterygia]
MYTLLYCLERSANTAMSKDRFNARRRPDNGSLTGTKLRNSLSTEVFEALQLLKSAYRNGHISAGAIAARHIDALIAELDADFGYDAQSEDSETDE